MCKGSRYLRLRLDADQIDALNAFLARVMKYDCYDLTNAWGSVAEPLTDGAFRFKFVARPIREMAAYWQGVFQQALEQSTYTNDTLTKGDS